MGDIGIYIAPLISLAALVGVVSAVSTEDFSEHTLRASRVIAAFILLSSLIPALGELGLPNLPELDGVGSELVPGYVEVSREAFGDGIAAAVAERVGVARDGISVEVDGFSFEAMRADSLTVTLPKEAAFADTRELSVWLKENFLSDGGRCEVVMDFG